MDRPAGRVRAGWSGVSRAGVSRTGVSRAGVSRTGVSRTGVSRTGVSRAGGQACRPRLGGAGRVRAGWRAGVGLSLYCIC